MARDFRVRNKICWHRYMFYRMLTRGVNSKSFFRRDECVGGCPRLSHCQWGFCECDAGANKQNGQCIVRSFGPVGRDNNVYSGGRKYLNFDKKENISCNDNAHCQYIDVNMICNMTIGICQCRNFMKVKVNPSSSQCQLYLDVDCSKISYDSEPSAVVLEAANKTLDKHERRQTIKRKTKLQDWQVNQKTYHMNWLDQATVKMMMIQMTLKIKMEKMKILVMKKIT